MGKPFPRRNYFRLDHRISLLLFLLALGLYGLTMSRVPFPGYPAHLLRTHLALQAPPPLQHSLWGWVIRVLARLPGVPVALGASVFSALCGAGCVALLAGLMSRVRYRGLSVDMPQALFVREAQARRLSGLVAGLFLAVCIPFWVASTRSLPDTFHGLLLLLAAGLFSQYQQAGRQRHLALLGVLYGVGITESATFLLFLPVAAVLVLREMYRFRTIRTWRPHALFWGGCLLGLCLYPVHVAVLVRRTLDAGSAASFLPMAADMLREQFWGLLRIRFNTGFIALMFMTLVPWLLLFTLSRRSPWYYDHDHVLVRFALAAGLLAVLFNAPFAFWNFLGMDYLMLPPHMLLAAGMGFMAGEFWLVGTRPLPSDASRFRRAVQAASKWAAVGLPVVLVAGGVRNMPLVNTRPARRVHDAVQDTLNRLKGRTWVFSHGALDDLLYLAARDRSQPVQLISIQQMRSPVFLQDLARRFPEGLIREALERGDPDAFLDELLLSPKWLSRVAILDMTDVFRPYGHLVPDGLLYRMVADRSDVDWPALAEGQRELWEYWSGARAQAIPAGNPMRPYLNLLRGQVAKIANNLGVVQMERADPAAAETTFRAALRIDPDNLSARMNLLDLLRLRDSTEADEVEAAWREVLADQADYRWALSLRYGYLGNPSEWLRRGHAWALSGQPAFAEGHRRRMGSVDLADGERRQFLDQVYLQWGRPPPDEYVLRSALVRNEREPAILRELTRLALRRGDPTAATAYLSEALAQGLSPAAAALDRVMVTYVRDGRPSAWGELRSLAKEDPANLQVWLAQALWSDPESKLNRRAVRAILDLNPDKTGLHLVLGWLYLCRNDWDAARQELETAAQAEPRNPLAWELLLVGAQIHGQRGVVARCRKTLLEINPAHPVRRVAEAVELGRRGKPDEAEALLRQGLAQERNPDLLYVLASSIMEQDDRWAGALDLLNEALLYWPFHPRFRLARAECLVRLGRLDEVAGDMEFLRDRLPQDVRVVWLDVRLRTGRGEMDEALAGARELARRRDELPADLKRDLKDLVEQMRTP